MDHILDILGKMADANRFKILQSEIISLDHERGSDYQDAGQYPTEQLFENPPIESLTNILTYENYETILRFFLDGSRRTYKVADIIIDGRYLPLVAGQVGVGVIRRNDDGTLMPLREYCTFKNYLAVPNKIPDDNLLFFQKGIDAASEMKIELISYNMAKASDPLDLGIAKIMSEMQNLEISTVIRMAENNLLSSDKILVIDGPLRFKKTFDLVQFRNVIGLSKSFKPSFEVGRGQKKRDIGAITSDLEFGQRTPVLKIEEGDKTIGAWYLRLRPKKMMSNPLDGIIKIECYAIEANEMELGLDGERVNTISSMVLRERNVTAYGKDPRWAGHIYPIYMAERFLKSSFMSDMRFKAGFRGS